MAAAALQEPVADAAVIYAALAAAVVNLLPTAKAEAEAAAAAYATLAVGTAFAHTRPLLLDLLLLLHCCCRHCTCALNNPRHC
jgi:hypothetical protein